MTQLTEHLRPKNVGDYFFSKDYERVNKYLNNKDHMPHILVYGSPGTGKTTFARVLAKELLGSLDESNFLQINASADRGVDVVRDTVKAFVANDFQSFFSSKDCKVAYKIVFFDEADSLTKDAQTALRNMMETYAVNSRFIFSCNDVKQIIDPLVSRCKLQYFAPFSEAQILNILQSYSETLNLKLTEAQLTDIVSHSQGDLRKAINKLAILEDLYVKDEASALAAEIAIIDALYDPDRLFDKQLLLYSKLSKIDAWSSLYRAIAYRLYNSTHHNNKTKIKLLSELARSEYAITIGGSPFLQTIRFAQCLQNSLVKK